MHSLGGDSVLLRECSDSMNSNTRSTRETANLRRGSWSCKILTIIAPILKQDQQLDTKKTMPKL